MPASGPATAVNCSIGRPDGEPDLERAEHLGLDRIELWWPWKTPEPSDGQVDELVDELRRRGLSLVAVNFWAGDLAAGQRGVLHEENLSIGHFDAISRLAEATGADRFNLLVGRGGPRVRPDQLDRIAGVTQVVEGRGLGTVLIEPSSGVEDYPITTVVDALGVIRSFSSIGLLADLWHLSNTDDVQAWIDGIEDIEDDAMPAHVQIADDPGRGAPGTGELPLEEWVSALHAAGYSGDVAGEWMW